MLADFNAPGMYPINPEYNINLYFHSQYSPSNSPSGSHIYVWCGAAQSRGVLSSARFVLSNCLCEFRVHPPR